MKLLILGGTVFLGRHVVEAALERGHEVTLFTRGRHNPDLFPDVEHLRGDRDGNLDALRGRTWDAVIDTSGYVPRVVGASARLLAPAVGRYAFISTISVYADSGTAGQNEDSPLATMPDETVEEITGETYGPLKVLSESAVEQALPGRTLVIRPGLIVGPHDPTDRFTYWPRRVARGGTVLAPGNPSGPVQFIDVRDLAEWTVRLIEDEQTGVFNATGPDRPLPMRELLEASREVSGSDAEIVWVPEQFLLEREVQPWTELPVWVPDDEENHGFHQFDPSKALSAGLTFRPLEETIRDTLAWDASLAPDRELRAGMEPGREASLLEEWGRIEGEILAARVDEVVPLNGPIEIAEYAPQWPALFKREAQRIRGALGERVVSIDHAGSTSVPGLAAKPIIDIVLAVADTADEAAYVPDLEAAGYVLRIREPEWYEHRVLKGPDTEVNLHVFPAGCPEIDSMLLFRDHLRRNRADRELYERTKRELARKNWKYVQNYADAKTEVVKTIMERARAHPEQL